MFNGNLSKSILYICDVRNLSYESISALCDISVRYLGSIARGRANQPMRLIAVRRYPTCTGSMSLYPVCPRCNNTIKRQYQAFCDRCGQRLDWSFLRDR